jgi:hypothetical protein
MAADVRVYVDVRADDGGDVEVGDLPQLSHREVACSTALQVEYTTSSEVLTVVLPHDAEREAEYIQWKKIITCSQ